MARFHSVLAAMVLALGVFAALAPQAASAGTCPQATPATATTTASPGPCKSPPPCPAAYDYNDGTYNPNPQQQAPNRCPHAKLNPDFSVSSNCRDDRSTLTSCFGPSANSATSVSFTLYGNDSKDPDPTDDQLYYNWQYITSNPSGWPSPFNPEPGCDPSLSRCVPISGCSLADSTCTLNPPYLSPSDPQTLVLTFQLTVADRNPASGAPDIRWSLPAYVNVTVTNTHQPPTFLDGGNSAVDFTDQCLPTVPAVCPGVLEVTNNPQLAQAEGLDIVHDRHYVIQMGTNRIADDTGVVSTEAFLIDSATGKVVFQIPLQKQTPCNPRFNPETCIWQDTITRPGEQLPAPGIPIDTRNLVTGSYNVSLVAHNAFGGFAATDPSANSIDIGPPVPPIPPAAVGLYGVTPLASAVSNHCFPGQTNQPQQQLGPGQSLRVNVTQGVPYDDIADGYANVVDKNHLLAYPPDLYLWKVTYQTCIKGPTDPATGKPMSLIGAEHELASPYLILPDMLGSGSQEVMVRAYDRFRQVNSTVLPIALQNAPPTAKVVVPAHTYLNLTFNTDIFVHDAVDQSVLYTVLNNSMSGGTVHPFQARQTSAQNVFSAVPVLKDAYRMDVTGDGYADFLLDTDQDGFYDHMYDLEKHSYSLVTHTVDSKTKMTTYTVVLDPTARTGNPTIPADQTGRIWQVPLAYLECTSSPCATGNTFDVEGTGVLDSLVSIGKSGSYDHFVRPGSSAQVPLLPAQDLCPIPPAPATPGCLEPFVDTVDVDGDGLPDTTFDRNGTGVPDYFVPFGATDHSFGSPSMIQLVPGNGPLLFEAAGKTGTYDPNLHPTVLGFMSQAPTTWYRFPVERGMVGTTSYNVAVDDVVGLSARLTGHITTERAAVDAQAVGIQTSGPPVPLQGDLVNVTALVSIAAGPVGLPPTPLNVTFSTGGPGEEGVGCPLSGTTLSHYPPEAGLLQAPVRACMPDSAPGVRGVLFAGGVHRITATVALPAGIVETTPANNQASTTVEIYLGKVIDGDHSYYIHGDEHGLPRLPGGAVELSAAGDVLGTFDLHLDQSGRQAVYLFDVPENQNGVAVQKELHWNPSDRAHRGGEMAWSPTNDTNDPSITCRPGHTPTDRSCRPVTVISLPAGAETSPTAKSPDVSWVFVVAALALMVRRRR
ncbi:MAG: hypothetical protein ACYDBQ_05815 [Thermoplasmatota archaeon]